MSRFLDAGSTPATSTNERPPSEGRSCALNHNLAKPPGYGSEHEVTRYGSKHGAPFYGSNSNVFFICQAQCGSGPGRVVPTGCPCAGLRHIPTPCAAASRSESLCPWASWPRNHKVSQNRRMPYCDTLWFMPAIQLTWMNSFSRIGYGLATSWRTAPPADAKADGWFLRTNGEIRSSPQFPGSKADPAAQVPRKFPISYRSCKASRSDASNFPPSCGSGLLPAEKKTSQPTCRSR